MFDESHELMEFSSDEIETMDDDDRKIKLFGKSWAEKKKTMNFQIERIEDMHKIFFDFIFVLRRAGRILERKLEK